MHDSCSNLQSLSFKYSLDDSQTFVVAYHVGDVMGFQTLLVFVANS